MISNCVFFATVEAQRSGIQFLKLKIEGYDKYGVCNYTYLKKNQINNYTQFHICDRAIFVCLRSKLSSSSPYLYCQLSSYFGLDYKYVNIYSLLYLFNPLSCFFPGPLPHMNSSVLCGRDFVVKIFSSFMLCKVFYANRHNVILCNARCVWDTDKLL